MWINYISECYVKKIKYIIGILKISTLVSGYLIASSRLFYSSCFLSNGLNISENFCLLCYYRTFASSLRSCISSGVLQPAKSKLANNLTFPQRRT